LAKRPDLAPAAAPVPNEQQLAAIEAVDGPVLVVAGPGTGKTQLLSLRVANILATRDVSPENILCLTFTDAGAEAMSKRLAQMIGKAAYEVRINTFHAFSEFLRSRYIEYYDRSPFDAKITDLQALRVLRALLEGLSVSDPLYQRSQKGGVPGQLSQMQSLISKIKRSGLSTDELRLAARQSLETIDYLEQQTDLVEAMCAPMPKKAEAKSAFCDELKTRAALILSSLPAALTERRLALPGSYDPYGLYLAARLEQTEWYEGTKTTGLQALKKELFDTKAMSFNPVEKRRHQKMLSALDVFDRYQEFLVTHGLYDYDDMILDTVAAIETHAEFQRLLEAQYRYLLVDEFQDTNGSQMRLVELLSAGQDSPNIMAVGDDDQAIMRFQGASVAFLKQFEEKYLGTRRIVLQENFRSTPSLVGLGGAIARQIVGRSEASAEDKRLFAHRREERPTQFSVNKYLSCELQYYDIARSIKERIDAGFIEAAADPAEAIAVIAWKRSSLEALIPYLKVFGIDYRYDVTATVGKSEPLQGFLACLHYVAHLANGNVSRADPWLPQVVAAPELGVAAEEYVRFALQAGRASKGWSSELLRLGHDDDGADDSFPQLAVLREWLAKAVKAAAASSAQRVIHILAKPFIDYYQGRIESDPFTVMELNYGIAALLGFVIGEAEAEHQQQGGGRGRSLRLAQVVELLEETDTYGLNINIPVPVSRPSAISLKSAHGSKGLEYDLVYLLDADEKSWHSKHRRPDIACPNIYLSESPDDDDMRRLLFVACTRAKYELQMSIGRAGVAAELLEVAPEVAVELSEHEVAEQSMVTWEDSYFPDNPQMLDLVYSELAKKKLSATMLNNFVHFGWEGDGSTRGFVFDQVFRFPRPPISYFEFGNLAHRYLELYLRHVVQAASISPTELLAAMHREIEQLDFDQADLGSMHERLDLIAEVFIPQAGIYLKPDSLSEQWLNAFLDGVPLVGKSDLLVFDAVHRTIQIADYKTGKPKTGSFDADYRRQLIFYKLLIEEGGQYSGWKVAGGMDIFIEPDPKTKELPDPLLAAVSEADVEHVRQLIRVVYWRIQNADFDTSAFREKVLAKIIASDEPLAGEADSEANPEADDIQLAFELWLIDDYEQRSSASH